MLIKLPGGNSLTHPPAMWFRSIFDPVVNMYTAISLPSSLQPLLTTWQDGSTLRSSSFFSSSFAAPSPLLLSYRKWLSPKARLATQLAVEPPCCTAHLLVGLIKGKWCPLFTCVHLLSCKGLRTSSWWVKRKHHAGISPGHEEGASTEAKSCFSTWTLPLVVEKSHLYAVAFQSILSNWKKPKDFPPVPEPQRPRLLQSSWDTSDFFTQLMFQALKSKIPPQPLPLPKGEFPQAAPHRFGVTSPAFTNKARSNL